MLDMTDLKEEKLKKFLKYVVSSISLSDFGARFSGKFTCVMIRASDAR